MSIAIKVNWQDEELDTYYKKMGYPKAVWTDNEGLPFGIKSEHENEWFSTERERDFHLFLQTSTNKEIK